MALQLFAEMLQLHLRVTVPLQHQCTIDVDGTVGG